MSKQYYQDKRTSLRASGKIFAERNPKLAKLYVELAELSHLLMQLLWLDFLRPFPSLAVEGQGCKFNTANDCAIHLLKIVDRQVLRAHERNRHFPNAGDMYLFCSMWAEFFRLYSTVNSFHELEVHELNRGEYYGWPAKIGDQPVI